MTDSQQFHFADFTHDKYRDYIKLAKQKWKFGFFPESLSTKDRSSSEVTCLWRHDLDLSLDRALDLARIEYEEGVVATYFIHLHNFYYNPIEIKSLTLFKKIQELGHEIGLHFDVFYYQQRGELNHQSELEPYVKKEIDWFQEWFGCKCRVISFHNPDNGIVLDYSSLHVGGVVNATAHFFQTKYDYISDSNGYWRFKRLEDFLITSEAEKIHVLSHPEWWTTEVLSTEQRYDSAVFERANKQLTEYKLDLKARGRLMP